MLNPSIGKLINNCENRYALVNKIAKKARKISEEYVAKEEILIDKPVSIAIDELAKDIED